MDAVSTRLTLRGLFGLGVKSVAVGYFMVFTERTGALRRTKLGMDPVAGNGESVLRDHPNGCGFDQGALTRSLGWIRGGEPRLAAPSKGSVLEAVDVH